MPLLHTLMILPRRPSSIGWMNRRVTFSAPNTLTANMRSQSASLVSRVVTRPCGGYRSRWRMPALFTSTSTGPKESINPANSATIAWFFVHSIPKGSPLAPAPGEVARHDFSTLGQEAPHVGGTHTPGAASDDSDLVSEASHAEFHD